MSPTSVFTITYWGITGTIGAPLRPAELTDRLVAALRLLAERGRLAELAPGAGLEDAIRKAMEQELPFHLRAGYGGNTTCVEVQTPDALIILDCGGGFRPLGLALQQRWQGLPHPSRCAHILLTHPHGDHIAGTPFFPPYYDAANTFTIHGTRGVLDSLAAVLDPRAPLSQVFVPPTFEQMTALKGFTTFRAGDEFKIGSTTIRTCALDHPGGCTAFRLENAGRSYVFATDHEQRQAPDPVLVEFARDADVLYTEGQYTLAEYEGRAGIAGGTPQRRVNWGHSPLEFCATTAVAAGVRQLHVGHRDPGRNDEQIAAMETYLQELVRTQLASLGQPPESCRACIPYEGLTLSL
jgi:phosphoribosyl 1,2-cyclic phosphodiesterase